MTTTDGPDMEWKARFVNEELVDLALELIAAVHDDGPAAVRDVLARVPYEAHDSLAVVLAAACDPTKTPTQMLGWVDRPLGIASLDPAPRNLERQHGTPMGYRQHRKHDDMPACEPCLTAHNAANRNYKRAAKASAAVTQAVA